jgi:hypothetical protein
MTLIKFIGKKQVLVGKNNPECTLYDTHEKELYEVNGKKVVVYISGDNMSKWMNALAIIEKYPVSDCGRRSRILKLDEKGVGVWLNLDQQGFSQLHLWIIAEDTLDDEELEDLIKFLEDKFEKEYQEQIE